MLCHVGAGHMTVICRYILFTKVYAGIWRSYAGIYFSEKCMTSCDGHMLHESSTGYGGIWPSYDSLWWKISSHSCCCDQYKTCYTGHGSFCFCTRYMTSCDWNMLAHPALLSFVPGGTRLARLNARLNAAHLLRPKCTLSQAQITLLGRAPASCPNTTLPSLLPSVIHLLRGRDGRGRGGARRRHLQVAHLLLC